VIEYVQAGGYQASKQAGGQAQAAAQGGGSSRHRARHRRGGSDCPEAGVREKERTCGSQAARGWAHGRVVCREQGALGMRSLPCCDVPQQRAMRCRLKRSWPCTSGGVHATLSAAGKQWLVQAHCSMAVLAHPALPCHACTLCPAVRTLLTLGEGQLRGGKQPVACSRGVGQAGVSPTTLQCVGKANWMGRCLHLRGACAHGPLPLASALPCLPSQLRHPSVPLRGWGPAIGVAAPYICVLAAAGVCSCQLKPNEQPGRAPAAKGPQGSACAAAKDGSEGPWLQAGNQAGRM